MIKVIYIDDQIESPITKRIQSSITLPGQVECVLRLPPTDLAEIASWELDIFLIDYDLASAKVDDKLIGYSGNSLATEVRNKKPFCPIIMVSRKEALTARGLNITTARSDLDLILYKDEIISNKSKFQSDVLTLYAGFKKLEAVYGRPWKKVLELIGASPKEEIKLREAFPPIEEDRHWFIPATAEWIRNVLMKYPGILYDDLYAAARLGISLESFLKEDVQKFFISAKYTGVFSGFGDRWWSDRLIKVAKDVIRSAEMEGAVFEVFALAYEKVYGQNLILSTCAVDRTPIADQVCYILREPVKRQNSILYYPDMRPSIMDTARVSLKAIREKDEFDENLVDADSFAVVKKLWGIK